MKYMVNSVEKPQKYPIYYVHSNMDSFILCNLDSDIDKNTTLKHKHKEVDSDNLFVKSLY